MKKSFLSLIFCGAAAITLTVTGCKKNDDDKTEETQVDRWITVSGALMETAAGDGDGGTMVYSVSADDAKNPNVSINVFDNGEHVKSDRTARLQASADGKYLYNIQYTGDDGGIFHKYIVKGGKKIERDGPEVATADYVSTSPRWLKAAEGIGVAVRATANPVVFEGASPNFVFKQRIAKTDVITLDLNNPSITKNTSFDLALTPDEVAAGYYVSRIDVPIINKAGNKVFIGAAVSKHNITSFTLGTDGLPTFAADNVNKSWAKTLVLDYPTLANPKIITSNQTKGNTNGYRSTQQYIGTDGHIYQSTSGEVSGGSKILRINAATHDYDNDYVFSLDAALGVSNSFIESWKYVGDDVAFVVYAIGGSGKGGYIAHVDLKAKTATKYVLPNEATLNFRQIQNITQYGDEVFIAVAPVGQDGNIYVFNRKTGKMTVGAKLVNKPGNQYIGVY